MFKKFIYILEIREYYLLHCNLGNGLDFLLFGKLKRVKPTLSGFIKYWREFQIKHPDVKIIYKHGNI